MHFVFLTRGRYESVEEFITELRTRFLPFEYFDQKERVMKKDLLPIRVCPVQLWDVSFPEDYKDQVLNHILQSGEGKAINPHLDKFSWGMRKAMKLDKIEYDKTKGKLGMHAPEHIEILGIGTKKDKWLDYSDPNKSKFIDKKHAKKGFSHEGI